MKKLIAITLLLAGASIQALIIDEIKVPSAQGVSKAISPDHARAALQTQKGKWIRIGDGSFLRSDLRDKFSDFKLPCLGCWD